MAEAPSEAEPLLYVDLIRQALWDEMQADETVYVMGQDVAEFGGPFNITMGFLEEFGSQRIFNTPISESGTVGIAVGSAMLGQKPVVEMQFADFVTCGFNQLVNVAAKMFYRTQQPVPLVIRLPSGGGVGAGAFHSQNLEALFCHTPGLKVVAPATAEDAYLLLREAIRDPNPVLYFEHKYLYRRQRAKVPSLPPEYSRTTRPLTPRAAIRRPGNDVSIISYGWMVHRSLEAAEALAKEGIEAEVIDLRVLAPLDTARILESVTKTNRAVIVHEATITCGIGAEISALIAEHAVEHLDGPIRRVAYPDQPVPFHKSLEAAALPNPDKIAQAVRAVVNW